MIGAKTTTVASCAFGALTALGLAGIFAVSTTGTHAQQRGAGAVAIDADDIGGVVTGPKGPEAGVWVVAETTDTPTRFIRSVVTDDQGRYVVPDLPRAKYQVFVRGYGLVDSPKVVGTPGQLLNLRAVPAPDARAAAQIYPPAYWLSLMEIPKGAMPEREVLSAVKECMTCHQLGNQATREISKSLGSFPSSREAWDHRVTVGPMGLAMSGSFQRFGDQRRMFSEWTDRIAAGAVPKQAPPRPSGLERNVVVTLWDWAVPTGGRSDGAASDDRSGTNNANGPIWGVIQSDDLLVSIDPVANRADQIVIPTSGPTVGAYKVPSPSFPEAPIWQRKSDPRSVAIDHNGRVWLTGRIRGNEVPGFCKPGSTNKFTSYSPILRPGTRQVMVYERRSSSARSTPASTPITTTLPRTPSSRCTSGRTIRSAGSTPRSGTRRRTPKRLKAGALPSSTRPATARSRSGLNQSSRPIRRRIAASRSAATRSASTTRMAASGARGSDRATTSWCESSAARTRRCRARRRSMNRPPAARRRCSAAAASASTATGSCGSTGAARTT
jgi:hypothetical protein